MKKITILLLLMLTIIFLASCLKKGTLPPSSKDFDYESNALSFADKLITGDYENIVSTFSLEMKTSLPKESLQTAWESTIAESGAFLDIETTKKESTEDYEIVTVFCQFKNNGVSVRIVYNDQFEVSGLYFNYYDPGTAINLPEGIKEQSIIVGENTTFPLKGKITSSKKETSEIAVVLVHGSGPQDMDSTIFTNKPFRDIAWGLASYGIDVLRYNKRTYSHGASLSKDDLATLTVEQETIEDAILAANLLQEKGYKHIFLIGHSLGGMLSMRIETESDGLFSGIIMLASSPRTLIDIIIDQNEDYIATLTLEKDKKEGNKIVKDEKNKLLAINDWNQKQLKENTIFGLTGNYVKDLLTFDTAQLASNINKPVLVLQGAKDFQIYADKDFPLWKEALAHNKNAEFILYDNLNHLFMLSQGESAGTIEEYKISSTVDQKVIEDMSNFIKKHSN